MKKRVERFLEGKAGKIISLISMLLAIIFVITVTVVGIRRVTEKYVDIPQLPKVEISETDRKVYIPDSVLEMMNEDEWQNESSGDKLALLQTVADYCSAELGIEKLTVEFVPYGSQQMYARLNEPEKKIEVRSDLLDFSFIGCAGYVCRSAYNYYELRLIEAYNATPDWAKNLSIYNDVKVIAPNGTVDFGGVLDMNADAERPAITYSFNTQNYLANRIFRVAESNGKAVMSDHTRDNAGLDILALVYERHIELVTYCSNTSYDFDSEWASECFEPFADIAAMAKSFTYVDVNCDNAKDACFTDGDGKKYVFLQTDPLNYEYSNKKYDVPEDSGDEPSEEASSLTNPIDSFFASHCLSEDTSSNVNITNFAFARADAWCVEFENAVSILKSSVNKHYGDREYIDEALEKMSAGMESLTEYGSDIVTLASSSNVFVDPENDKYDEEIYEGTGAGVSRANTIADIYRSEALRLYDGILTVYENEGLDDLFIFDPDKLVETLKNKGIELVKNRIEK